MLRAIGIATACLALIVPNITGQTYPTQDRPSQDSNVRDRNHQGRENGTFPDRILAGTRIKVRTNDTIDVREQANNRVYAGTVAEDVNGENGNVLIPRGANAELMVTSGGNNDLAVDLE